MRHILLAVFLSLALTGMSQEVHLYHPEADALVQVKQGVKEAQQEHKHLLLQIGGNWCPWCLKFNKFCEADTAITRLLKKSFVVLHVNYSKENRNWPLLKMLSYPQRFGFPVFVILDGEGNRIHTQNSSYLEEGDGYSKKKVFEFLNQWSPDMLDPKRYPEK